MVLSARVACMPAIWAFCSAWARAATAFFSLATAWSRAAAAAASAAASRLFLPHGLVASFPGLVPLGNGLAPLPGDADHAGDRWRR